MYLKYRLLYLQCTDITGSASPKIRQLCQVASHFELQLLDLSQWEYNVDGLTLNVICRRCFSSSL